MLRHQISEIIRETINLSQQGVTKKSSMEAADHIIALIRDEAALRAEYAGVDISAAHLALPG